MADNTFLGLQPYTEDDAYRFKGRTEESQELFRLIVRNDFTVCYAESGEGKTSLLNAGVFPLLRENMCFPIAITFTSDDYKVTPDSFDTIIDRCVKDSIAEYNEKNKGVNVEYKLCSTDFQGLDCQVELQRELSKYSWWKLRNYKPQAMGLTFVPVFVFDQFEEVFNLPGSIVWIKRFFDWLENVSSDSCPEEIVDKVRDIIGNKAAFPTIKEEKGFKAVFSLRKEFIGELDYWGMQTHFIPALKDNRYCLKALTYEEAKKVMTQQERFDEGTVEQVLKHFVGQYSREPENTIAENLPAIPALLLSVVCDSWEKDFDFFNGKEGNEIAKSLNEILERFFNKSIFKIVNQLYYKNYGQIETIKEGVDSIVFQLVDKKGRRLIIESRLCNNEQLKKVLCDSGIIKISIRDGIKYIELGDESWCSIITERKMLYVKEGAEINKNNRLKYRDHRIDFREKVEAALFALIDINGKRVRRKITSARFKEIDFDTRYKKILCDNHIIKITKIDGEDYVELVHDCLCPIISKRRELEKERELKKKDKKLLWSYRAIRIIFLIVLSYLSITSAFYQFNDSSFCEQINLKITFFEQTMIGQHFRPFMSYIYVWLPLLLIMYFSTYWVLIRRTRWSHIWTCAATLGYILIAVLVWFFIYWLVYAYSSSSITANISAIFVSAMIYIFMAAGKDTATLTIQTIKNLFIRNS